MIEEETHNSFAFPIEIYLYRRFSVVVCCCQNVLNYKNVWFGSEGPGRGETSLIGISPKFLQLFWPPSSQNLHPQNTTYIMPKFKLKFYLSFLLFSAKPKRESKIWANVILKPSLVWYVNLHWELFCIISYTLSLCLS